jgi:hypothetical protein
MDDKHIARIIAFTIGGICFLCFTLGAIALP